MAAARHARLLLARHSFCPQAHDRFVNDKEMCLQSNLIVLNVSATPYCLFTLDSRVPDEHPTGQIHGQMHEPNLVVWQEVLGDFPRRTSTKEEDLDWLELQFGGACPVDPPYASPNAKFKERFMLRKQANVLLSADKHYQSLDVHLKTDGKTIRVDNTFEETLTNASQANASQANASRLLAVVSSNMMQCFCIHLHPG